MKFDADKATRVCRFFEVILGFQLLGWQRKILRRTFGLVGEDGLRVIRKVYLELPKKNGKSTLAAGLPLFMLLADEEPGAEIYSAATTREQAAIVFRQACKMVRKNAFLDARLKIIRSTKTIYKIGDPTSFYRAVTADGGAQDGIEPHCVIIDELHRWKTAASFELYDVLTKGTITRRQPLVFEITTAGSTEDESPICWGEHEYTSNIAAGLFEDPAFYGLIFAADLTDDWTKPETWAKANPSLDINGGFVPLSALKSEFDKALNQPRRQAAFKRYHLGIWTSTDEEWMPRAVWDACNGELGTLIERPCYLGLDLSSTIDLTSLVALFPTEEPDGTFSFDVKPWFWMAKERVRERELADRVAYSTWINKGLIEVVDGDVIDLRDIQKKVEWCTEVFDVRELGFDPAHALQLSIQLSEYGVKCVPVPFRFTHISEPTKKFIALAMQKKLRHAGNPVLRWNAHSLRVHQDDKDNILPIKPDRGKSGKRIDGMVAAILALSRAMYYVPSVYDKRGLATL